MTELLWLSMLLFLMGVALYRVLLWLMGWYDEAILQSILDCQDTGVHQNRSI